VLCTHRKGVKNEKLVHQHFLFNSGCLESKTDSGYIVESKTKVAQKELQGVKKVAVVVEQNHNFEVMQSRAKTNYGLFYALGGVPGMAIAHGIDKGKDMNEAAPMMSAVQDVCCSSIFTESLAPLFEPNRPGRIYILTGENQKINLSDYDAVVTFTIDRWGLRLTELATNNPAADKLASFVKVYAKMVSSKNKKTIWKRKELITGDRHENLTTFTANSEMLRNELRETIKKAGVQMSNALIQQ
jgi:hypothetical protein